MIYVKNADLTKCHIACLINKCEYKDITSAIHVLGVNVRIK